MFTGLIEGTGKIVSIEQKGGGREFIIQHTFLDDNIKTGDSIAINGVCLTVEKIISGEKKIFFYASYKTLELTTLGLLETGNPVNLERALLPTSRMGGHIVQGHVDGFGDVTSVQEKEDQSVYVYKVKSPERLIKYIVERGSIAVDGISLTVVSVNKLEFELVIIPETIRKTNISNWKTGSKVNIETDIMARYIEKLVLKS